MALVLGGYAAYTYLRNEFGSASVEPETAFANAERVIELEQRMGLFFEEDLQAAFVDHDWFLWSWNVFYGSLHFLVTIFALVWLYRRFPDRYRRYRNMFAAMTLSALAGFSSFPLMPPRLLAAGPPYGAADLGGAEYEFVDTLATVGGLWSFDSGTMQEVSNQYAAMPSLHFAWAMFCAVALVPTVRNPLGRAASAAYPVLTLFAIVVTGNHYWIDAVGGLVVLGVGALAAATIDHLGERRAEAEPTPPLVDDVPDMPDDPSPMTPAR